MRIRGSNGFLSEPWNFRDDGHYMTIWNTCLTSSERAQLVSGKSPLLIKPDDIVFHEPFTPQPFAEPFAVQGWVHYNGTFR
jgi:hypothetical protein